MKRWWRFIIIIWLGASLSLGLNLSLKAQILPSQLVRQAQEAYQIGEFEQSIRLLKQVNRVDQNQEKYLQQAQILSLTSLAQQQLGNWDLASQNISDSLALMDSVASSQNKTRVLAQIWNTKGHLQFLTGKSDRALKDWQTAEKLYRQGDDRLGIAGSLLNQAQVLERMGFYRRACNRVLEAFDRPDYSCEDLNASQLTSIIKQAKEQTQPWQVEGLIGISNSLLLMGELSQAIAFTQASQTVNSNLTNPSFLTEAKIWLSLGNINKAIALQERQVGNFNSFAYYSTEAIKYYRQLISDRAYPKLADKYQIPAQLNLLSLFIVTEQWSEARQLVSQIDLHQNNRLEQANLFALVKFARDLERLKQNKLDLEYSWQDIARIYLDASEQAQLRGDRRVRSYALGYLGELQTKQPDIKLDTTPQQLIEKALSLSQQIRASEISFRWQWQLGRIYRQQGRRQAAIASYQASLATLIGLRSDLATLTQEVQFDFYEQIEPVYRELADLLLTEHPSNEDLETADDVIEALHIAELDNYFQDACLTFDPDLDRVDKDVAIFYTVVLQDRLEVIMMTRDGDRSLPSPVFSHHSEFISQTEIEETIAKLRQYITEPDRTKKVQQLSAQIYDWLIRPFAVDLETQKPDTLVFVLDSILLPVPMSVLYDGKQYLVEKYAIALTPSLRSLNPQLPTEQSTFLAGGISQRMQVANQKFAPLDHVKAELAVFPEDKSQILLNRKFTPANLGDRINATSASHIHLATHGQFSSDPNKTFLLMWQKLLTIKKFSLILLKRKKIVTAPIDLLVLSACDTALGDRRAALGLAGIAVRSGALTTIATLWQINDESTAVLMKNFYQNLENNYSKAKALQQAQLQLWQRTDKDWKVPAFWSAYILIGNWQ